MAAAKALFEEADADGNRMIDEQELAWMMQRYWERINVPTLQSNSKTVAAEAKKFIDKFGNEEGMILYPQFVRMLTLPPWKDLLSPEAREGIKFELLKMTKEGDMTAAEQVVNNAYGLFQDLDADNNGVLDSGEFEVLLQALWEKLKRSPADKEHLVERALNRYFGDDLSGNITFVEFVGILGQDPWNKTLPTAVRDDMKLLALRNKADGKVDADGKAVVPAEDETTGSPGGNGGTGSPGRSQSSKPHKPKLWPYSAMETGEIKSYMSPKASPARARVRVYRNDGGKTRKYGTVLVHTLTSLMDDATKALDLRFACNRVFTMDGKELKAFYPQSATLRTEFVGPDDLGEALEPGAEGLGIDVQDIKSGQSLVCSMGEGFKPRQGYASDSLLKSPSKKSPAKGKKKQGPAGEQFMASLRGSPAKGHLIADPEKYREGKLKEALQQAPDTTGDDMLDAIVTAMKDYYLAGEGAQEG